MDITYNIDFFSEWHCGSGLSGGATTDALLIKDKHNLPFIPGKTIKGLLREAVEDILSLGDYSKYESSFFEALDIQTAKTRYIMAVRFSQMLTYEKICEI